MLPGTLLIAKLVKLEILSQSLDTMLPYVFYIVFADFSQYVWLSTYLFIALVILSVCLQADNSSSSVLNPPLPNATNEEAVIGSAPLPEALARKAPVPHVSNGSNARGREMLRVRASQKAVCSCLACMCLLFCMHLGWKINKIHLQ